MEYLVPIIVAIIAGGFSFIGNVISNNSSNQKLMTTIENKFAVSQAITDTKLENLTQEVRRQTDFAIKIPVLEQRVSFCENDIKELKEK